MRRSFESLTKDLGEGEQDEKIRLVFDLDRIKKVFENPILRPFNVQVLLYICFNSFINEKIPSLEQIARGLNMKIETVKEEIENLKGFGFLE